MSDDRWPKRSWLGEWWPSMVGLTALVLLVALLVASAVMGITVSPVLIIR